MTFCLRVENNVHENCLNCPYGYYGIWIKLNFTATVCAFGIVIILCQTFIACKTKLIYLKIYNFNQRRLGFNKKCSSFYKRQGKNKTFVLSIQMIQNTYWKSKMAFILKCML